MSDVGENRPRPTAEESEGVFRAIFEQDAVGVAQIASETGDFVRINRRYAEIVGYTVAEMEQLTFQQITHPEDLQEDLANMQRLLAGETREFSMVKRYFHKDGSIVWINLTVSPMWEVGEEPTFHIAVVEDVTERKRGESALQEARDFAEHLVETANAIVVVLDMQGEIRVFNSAAERITGYTAEEIDGSNWFEVLVPRERYPEVWLEFERLMDGGIPQEFENPILTKDGEERHVVWKNNELIRNGEIVGLVSFGIDITERKRAEESLRESEEQLRTIMQTMPVMVDAFDDEQNIIVWNRECERVTGYLAEEIVGNPHAMELLYPGAEYREWVMSTVRKQEGDFRNLELSLACKNGEARTVLWSNLSASHPITGWATWAVGIDITERKQVMEELAATKGMLEAAISQSPSGIVIADAPDVTIRLANDAAFGIRGGDPKGLTGIDVTKHSAKWQILRPDASPFPPEQLPLSRAIIDGELTQGKEFIIRDVDGHDHWVSANAAPIRDEHGQVTAGIVVFHEITDRKQAEREREELITRLEAQNAELERFTYTVSHDLKSPLITIKGYIGMLFEDLQESEAESIKSDLIRISKAADKMGDLLSDLLELSRIGRLVNAPEDVPLDELAHEALQLVRGQMELRSVQVEVFSGLPVVCGDRTRLVEVLQNLIDNAAKYMGDEAHPRVEIGARQDKGEVVCYVRDNGIGIERRFHEKVFGLFDQLDPKVEGTGIGLALVRRIVEVHGGRIWIESEGQGRGSTFCFTIPAGPSPTTERSIEPESRC
jgi:PAS domain S-box-containing protein